jgi:hypothetical protein
MCMKVGSFVSFNCLFICFRFHGEVFPWILKIILVVPPWNRGLEARIKSAGYRFLVLTVCHCHCLSGRREEQEVSQIELVQEASRAEIILMHSVIDLFTGSPEGMCGESQPLTVNDRTIQRLLQRRIT